MFTLRRAVGAGAALAISAAGVAIIGSIDRVIWTHHLPRLLFAAGDEVAHLTTAVPVIVAVPALRSQSRAVIAAILTASVFIDLDHVPNEFFGSTVLTANVYRPYGHTLVFAGLVAAAGMLLLSRRHRRIALGAAIGMLLHLVRDCATGGAALFWPVSHRTITYPYSCYIAAVAIAFAAAGYQCVSRRLTKAKLVTVD